MNIHSDAKWAIYGRRVADQRRQEQERLNREAAMTDVERAERILAIMSRALARQNAGVPSRPLQSGDEEQIQWIAAFLRNVSRSENNEVRA